MKKGKQILALTGVVLLILLYLTTLVFALSNNDNSMNLLMASIVATIVIPVLLWAYSLVFRLVHRTNLPPLEEDPEKEAEDKENL